MIAIKRILVPTDFSDCSRHALTFAVAVAAKFQASLHLLHVVPALDLYGLYGLPAPAVLPDVRERARQQLDGLARAAGRGVPIETAVATGNAFLEIVTYAKAKGIDVIVMGTHGRGPVGRAVIGSVAEKVVRKAPCPVLTIRLPQPEPADS